MNGVDVHYVDAGTGPAVVLLHGFPEFWYSWRKQIPALVAAGLRVIAPDLRGYNESSKPTAVEDYRISVVAKDIAELIERLAGNKCVLVGHDWGAVTAWYVAMMRPDLLRKLAILNVSHPVGIARELKRSMRQKLAMAYQLLFQPPGLPEMLLPRVLPTVLRKGGRFTHEEIDVYRQAWRKPGAVRAMANYYRAMKRYRGEMRQLLKRIDIPTLFIWAEHEPVFRRETTEGWEEWVPDLRIARVAGAGHFVQTDEPEIVNDLLIDFSR